MGKFFFFLSSVNKETNACDSVEEWETKLKISVSSYRIIIITIEYIKFDRKF